MSPPRLRMSKHNQIQSTTNENLPSSVQAKVRKRWNRSNEDKFIHNTAFMITEDQTFQDSMSTRFSPSISSTRSLPVKPFKHSKAVISIDTPSKTIAETSTKRTTAAEFHKEPYFLSTYLLHSDYSVIHREHWLESYSQIPKRFPSEVQPAFTSNEDRTFQAWLSTRNLTSHSSTPRLSMESFKQRKENIRIDTSSSKSIESNVYSTKRTTAKTQKDQEPYILSTRLLRSDYSVIHREHWIEGYSRIRALEKTKIHPRYFPSEVQTEITPQMRTTLIDWIHKVHSEFGLCREVLYVAVSILDGLTCIINIPRHKFQIVGILALFFASQKFETRAPKLDNLLFVAELCYDAEVTKIETKLMHVLGEHTGEPMQLTALRIFHSFCDCDLLTYELSYFVLEVCLREYETSSKTPSMIALLALSRAVSVTSVGQSKLSELVRCSGFDKTELNFWSTILGIQLARVGGSSVHEKYTSGGHARRSGLLPMLVSGVERIVNNAHDFPPF